MLFDTSLTTPFDTALSTPMFGLRREMNRLFDDVLSRTTPTTAWVPPVDVREDEGNIALALELPGVRPEDVEVTADNGILTVRGTKQAERKEEDENQYHLIERSYGSFVRQFRLPKGVDDSKITANFEHGVLTVTVPKTALPQPKRIQIGAGVQAGNRVSAQSQQGAAQGSSTGSQSGSQAAGSTGSRGGGSRQSATEGTQAQAASSRS